MTKRDARRIAVRLAYEAVQKAVLAGGEEAGLGNVEDQIKIDRALDEIAQQMFERVERLRAPKVGGPMNCPA